MENVQVVGARNTYDWSSSHEKLYPHSQTCWHIDLTALFSWVCLKEMIEHWATFIPYIYNIKLYLLYVYIYIYYYILYISYHGHQIPAPPWASPLDFGLAERNRQQWQPAARNWSRLCSTIWGFPKSWGYP